MSDKKIQRAVIALGYFDSVHKGHQMVIGRAKSIADELGCILVVFTFKGNLKLALGGVDEKMVYLESEREKFYRDLGADEIYFAPVTAEFLSLDKLSFLDALNSAYDLKCYVSGLDYRFGKKGEGSVSDIKEYADSHGQSQVIVDAFMMDGQRVSTTRVKERLSLGDVEGANRLLGREYSVTGTVFHDRNVGKSIGIPTANIKIDTQKFNIKDGVYSGSVIVNGKEYGAVINYGCRPTFALGEKLIEAHLINFSGDLYGKEITVNFTSRIRDVIRFSDECALKEQITKDIEIVKGKKYD